MRSRPRNAVVLPILAATVVGACIPTAFDRSGPTAGDSSGSPSAAAISPEPSPSGPSAHPSFIRPTPTPLPTFLAHVVKRGDTLTSIARTYRTTARSIAFWNRGQYPSLDPDSPGYAPNRIEVGWILRLVPDVELDPEDLPPEPSPATSPSPEPTPSAS